MINRVPVQVLQKVRSIIVYNRFVAAKYRYILIIKNPALGRCNKLAHYILEMFSTSYEVLLIHFNF